MLKRQVWIVDDDEFDHIVTNSQRVLRLNDQYENHPYAQEFTKRCNVMYLEHTFWRKRQMQNFVWMIYGNYSKNILYQTTKQLLQTNDKLYEGMELPKNTSDFPLSTKITRQTRTTLMEDEKDVLGEEYRKSPVFCRLSYFCTSRLY